MAISNSNVAQTFSVFLNLLSNNAVGDIGEQTWDFPPHSHIHLKYDPSTPYNAILDGFKGYEVGCHEFIDKNTNNPITPKFHFYYANNTTPVSFSNCILNTIELGYTVVESPALTFRHTHNADVYILNESDVHILGIDCESGL